MKIKNAINVLERRRKCLQDRVIEHERTKRTGISYDLAEIKALDVALTLLHEKRQAQME